LFALIRAIELVGEAAGKVSLETQAQHPAIPWANVIGTRHRLVHAYFDVNHDILWTTIEQSLPKLREQIVRLFGGELTKSR